MDWIKSLQGLPLPVGILAVFTICMIGVLRSVFTRVIDPLTKSHQETSESIRKGLDENTNAVKKSVEHSEKIIENHLSHNGDLWHEVQGEMRAITDSLRTMNGRHRKYDEDEGGKDPR